MPVFFYVLPPSTKIGVIRGVAAAFFGFSLKIA